MALAAREAGERSPCDERHQRQRAAALEQRVHRLQKLVSPSDAGRGNRRRRTRSAAGPRSRGLSAGDGFLPDYLQTSTLPGEEFRPVRGEERRRDRYWKRTSATWPT